MLIMEESQNKQKADIRIIGVGGGGSNALEVMIKEGVQGAQFIAVNTDDQALESSSAKTKIQLGSKLTKGLGAGANPEVGRRAAIESYEEIIKTLKGADMVFVTAGMGGGTGTGGAPLVAQAAKELDILTVGIVTNPFIFEGKKRMQQAQQGIHELAKHVDTLIVIPNEKLLHLSQKDTPLFESFKITDDVLLQAVKGITELVSVPGVINLDFADIKTVMWNKGMALMGRGLAEGEERAKKAVLQAISSPLLESISIKGATGMIVNITAGPSLSLIEIQEASSILNKEADESADIIVGTVIDKNMGDKISVTVIATGFPNKKKNLSDESVSIPNKEEDIPSPREKNMPTDLNALAADVNSKGDEEKQNPLETFKTYPKDDSEQIDKSLHFEEDKNFLIDSKEDERLSTANKHIDFETDCEKEEPLNLSSTEEDGFSQKKENLRSPRETQTLASHLNKIAPEESPTEEKKNENKEKKLSPKEKLLLKVKEYAQNQKEKSQDPIEENQMIMDWKKDSLEESLSSPFESSVDFSEKDMI